MIDFARASSHQLRNLPPLDKRAPVCAKCVRNDQYRSSVAVWIEELARNDGYCDPCAAFVDGKLARGVYGGEPNAFVPAERITMGRVAEAVAIVIERSFDPLPVPDVSQHPM